MKKEFLISTLFLLLASFAWSSEYKVNTITRQFVDKYGRSRLFHGVNAVYKLPPYYPPVLDHFDAFVSLSDEDFKNLNSWGLNFIRLYLSWEATEKIRGQYNMTYLGVVRDIVRKAAKYNIAILLDAHQDLGSRKFCGEGLPDWAVNRTDFPAPLPGKISFDDQGYANLTDCANKKFAMYYTTNDVRKAFKNFYTDVDGIAESWTNFWKVVAGFFKDEPNVLGYDLLNEPPSFAIEWINIDLHYLQPLYKRVHEKIRQVDNNTIIFFEPNVFDVFFVGFTEGPGGPEYNDRQVLNYHLYCPTVSDSGEPISPLVCKESDTGMLNVKAKRAEELGLAAVLSEFGALSATPKSVDEVTHITDLADQHLHSWSYWQFKWYDDFTTEAKPGSTESFYYPDGSLQEPKVKALARSYAFATCGVPSSQKFDAKTGKFEFSYQVGKNCKGQPTEIFLSEKFYYPNGVKSQFKNCNGCSLKGGNNYYSIEVPESIIDGTLISITITNAAKASLEESIEFMNQ